MTLLLGMDVVNFLLHFLPFFSKIAAYIHNILSTLNVININTNACMCYST